MEAVFVDSEVCKIDGKTLFYFSGVEAMRDRIIKTLSEVGAERFFYSPDQKMQKERENMTKYFFVLALKKITGQDWFVMQPKDDPPDFWLISARRETKTFKGRFSEPYPSPSAVKSFLKALLLRFCSYLSKTRNLPRIAFFC